MKKHPASLFALMIALCLIATACDSGTSPAATYRVSYDGNGSTSGSVPIDSAAYSAGQSAVALGNTGSLAKTGYSFSGWNTKADGSGTAYAAGASLTIGSDNVLLYAGWTAAAVTTTAMRIIDHTNYDPSSLSSDQVTKAASLDVYFEHASVGQNIVDGIDALSLAAETARYTSGRTSGSPDSTWWDSHNGLGDNHRDNPGAAEKINLFATDMTAAMGAALDVAMFKFCYIDTPGGDQYLSKTASDLFAEAKTAIESLETTYPSVSFVWWTMPIERDSMETERQTYNDLVRAYCKANNKWLLDIADLESHDDSGNSITDTTTGGELLYAGYTSDGGHLNNEGAAKLAKAYWKLIGEIGKTK